MVIFPKVKRVGVLLQERVNEMESAILDILSDKIYITGFTREEMLERYLITGSQCFSSKELYSYQDLVFHNIQNNALVIVRKDGQELSRHQFKPIHKDTIQYKNYIDGVAKIFSTTFTIRRSVYSNSYHFLTEKLSELFDCLEDLKLYLKENFGFDLDFSEDLI